MRWKLFCTVFICTVLVFGHVKAQEDEIIYDDEENTDVATLTNDENENSNDLNTGK